MTEREQRLFDLGQNFPGLLTDEELREWACLRDRRETQPSEFQQLQWSVVAVITAVLLSVSVLILA